MRVPSKQNPLFSLALTLVPTEEKLCTIIKKGMALIPNLSCVLTYKIFNLEKYFLSRTQTISLPGSLLWDAKRKLVCSLWSWFELFKKVCVIPCSLIISKWQGFAFRDQLEVLVISVYFCLVGGEKNKWEMPLMSMSPLINSVKVKGHLLGTERWFFWSFCPFPFSSTLFFLSPFLRYLL